MPKGQLDRQLPLPKVYKYANTLPAHHPVMEKLDFIMQGWESQKTGQGSQMLVDRVGLELACAWLLQDSTPALDYVESHLQERLIVALDRLGAE